MTEPFYRRVGKEWLQERFAQKRMTTQEIAEEAKVPRSTVVYALRKYDLGLDDKAPMHETLDPVQLKRLYHEEGLTSAQVGKQMGVSATTVLAALRHHGIRVRGIGERPAQAKALWNDPTWLEERRRAGVTQTAMAKEAGCTVLTISRALQRHAAGESTRSTQDPVQCTDACRYFADCLDWPVDRPCPMVVERFSVKRIHPSPPDSILP